MCSISLAWTNLSCLSLYEAMRELDRGMREVEIPTSFAFIIATIFNCRIRVSIGKNGCTNL